jgi:osmotically-inducible protein OsmY
MANRDFHEEQNRYGNQGNRGGSAPSRTRGQQSRWNDERGENRIGGSEEDAWQSRDEEYGRERPRTGSGRDWSDADRESDDRGERYGAAGYGGGAPGSRHGGYGERGYGGGQYGRGERGGASIGGYGGGGGAYRGGESERGYGGRGRQGGDDDWGYGSGASQSGTGESRRDVGGQSGYGGERGFAGGMGRRAQFGTERGRGGWTGGQGDYGLGGRSGGAYGDDDAGGYEEFGEYAARRGSESGRGAWSRFGGERARGVQGLFSGRGPKGYERSDDRIREDVCDRLMDEGEVDASNLTVEVRSGEVTLEGTVDSKDAKRRAEDIAEEVPGVREVQNRLRVERNAGATGYGRETESAAPGLRSMSDTAGSTGGATTAGSAAKKTS